MNYDNYTINSAFLVSGSDISSNNSDSNLLFSPDNLNNDSYLLTSNKSEKLNKEIKNNIGPNIYYDLIENLHFEKTNTILEKKIHTELNNICTQCALLKKSENIKQTYLNLRKLIKLYDSQDTHKMSHADFLCLSEFKELISLIYSQIWNNIDNYEYLLENNPQLLQSTIDVICIDDLPNYNQPTKNIYIKLFKNIPSCKNKCIKIIKSKIDTTFEQLFSTSINKAI